MLLGSLSGGHRRVHRLRRRQPAAAGVGRARSPAGASGAKVEVVRRRRPPGDRRGGRAGPHRAACRPCRSDSGATPTAPATGPPTSSSFPGVWRHGDWITIDGRGTCIITGRSDATLNRGGVRIGTAEFYAVVERFDEVTDSLVVHLEDPARRAGRAAGCSWCCRAGESLDDASGRPARRRRCARDLSPRHVPDRIVPGPGHPPDPLGQEARGARQAHPVRDVQPTWPPAGGPWRIQTPWSPSRSWPGGATRPDGARWAYRRR